MFAHMSIHTTRVCISMCVCICFVSIFFSERELWEYVLDESAGRPSGYFPPELFILTSCWCVRRFPLLLDLAEQDSGWVAKKCEITKRWVRPCLTGQSLSVLQTVEWAKVWGVISTGLLQRCLSINIMNIATGLLVRMAGSQHCCLW